MGPNQGVKTLPKDIKELYLVDTKGRTCRISAFLDTFRPDTLLALRRREAIFDLIWLHNSLTSNFKTETSFSDSPPPFQIFHRDASVQNSHPRELQMADK